MNNPPPLLHLIMRLLSRSLVLSTVFFSSFDISAQIRFESVQVSSNRFSFSLLGQPGVDYLIESSADLTNWTGTFSGGAEDGRLDLEAEIDNARAYFRARPNDPQIPEITLLPSFNTNYTATTFATPTESKASLIAQDGTRFALSFPSNSVPEGTLASMTLATNLTGLPFSGPTLGAVRVLFDEDALIGTAVLTITFPTNLDRRKIVSFVANTNGTNFYLSADRIGTNIISIPVFHSGIFGASIATTQEIATAVQLVNSRPEISADDGVLGAQTILPTSRICFPTLVNRALRVKARITRAKEKLSSELAARLTTARQAQLAGEPDDSAEILSQVGQITCNFYNQNVNPYWAEASHNCALMGVLVQITLGLERQMQLFGVPDEERCTRDILSAERLCPGFKACLDEIKTCCSSGHQSRDRIRDLVTLVRQQALLGLNSQTALGCFGLNDPKTKEVIQVCIPMTWSGLILVQEQGETSFTTHHVNGFTEETENFDLTFAGYTTEARETVFGNSITAEVKIEGSLHVREFRDTHTELSSDCGTKYFREMYMGAGNDRAIYHANILVNGNGTYTLILGYIGKNELFEPVMGTEWNERIDTVGPTDIECKGFSRVMTTNTDDQLFHGVSLFPYTGTLGTNVNLIQGSAEMDNQRAVATKVRFTWSFVRTPR